MSKIGGQLYFIEFKNCDVKLYRKQIVAKARDSLSIYCSITAESVIDVRSAYDCIVVYAENKNSKAKAYGVKQISMDFVGTKDTVSSMRKIGAWLQKKAASEIVLFGMTQLQGEYFRIVHTYNEKEFAQFLLANNITQ